jgi:polar amino acid transport system substrate-binding protein
MKRIACLLAICLVLTSLILASCTNSSSPETPKIIVATDATWPPFESVNDQTKAVEGLDIDIMQAIADRQNLEVEFKNVLWDPLLAGMAKGMYDAAISSITITEERKKDMLFSDPYFAAGQLVVVQKNNSSITGKNSLSGQVGVQVGTTGDIEVQKIKAAAAKPYEKIELAFDDLLKGELNAVVCDNPVALLYVGKHPDQLKTVGAVFTNEQYGIAVAKSKKDLLKKMNAGLKALKNEGLIEHFSQKWLK